MGRQVEDVVVDVTERLLVEVVAHTGRMAEEVLDRDALIDVRQGVTDEAAQGRSQFQVTRFDERRNRQGGQALRRARNAEPGPDPDALPESAMGKPSDQFEVTHAPGGDGDDTREVAVLGQGTKVVGEAHRAILAFQVDVSKSRMSMFSKSGHTSCAAAWAASGCEKPVTYAVESSLDLAGRSGRLRPNLGAGEGEHGGVLGFVCVLFGQGSTGQG